MAEFRMPSLGADMDEGTLLEWLVHPGDPVHKGDIVAVVDTAKAAVEVECFDSGVVEQLLVEPGTRVPVGTVLATIAPPGTPVAPSPAPAVASPAPVAPSPAPVAPSPAPVPSPTPDAPVTSPLIRHLIAERHLDRNALHGTGPGGRITHADLDRAAATTPPSAPPTAPAAPEAPPPATPAGASPPPAAPSPVRASPLARRLAAELGVDLATVTGTGPHGAIDADDVRAAASTGAPPTAEPTPSRAPTEAAPVGPAPVGHPPRGADMRAAIAALMARSKREIPHYYLTETVDLGAALTWMRDRNRELPVSRRLVPAALLLKAAARAAVAVPQLNGFWLDGQFTAGSAVHLGVAVSLRGGGLVAPAIHDAADLPLDELMARLKDLVARARAGRLRRAELSDPTITVSNLGEQGAESILGVIYPPQVALVGFGRIVDRPWAVDGLIGVRPVVTASLSGDHRATDGATGARYLQTMAHLLATPEEL
ncbi:MAG TPA: 2-oxo acid dehydrogenase subunit E2 [Micromonosporaceae bacterium]